MTSLPIVFATALTGCASIMSDGGRSWTPDQGPPTCGATAGAAVDVVIAVGGVALLAASETCPDLQCEVMAGLGGGTLILSGVVGAALGAHKMSTCDQARDHWALVKRSVVGDIGGQLRARAFVLGDTLVVDAPTPALCESTDWYVRVHARRAVLLETGVRQASCRVGGVEASHGRLDD